MNAETQRPTPETDAMFSSTQGRSYIDIAHDAINFARNLECQRDEAREQLEAMREAIKEAHEVIEDADGSSYHILDAFPDV